MHFSSEDTILLAEIGPFNFEFGKKDGTNCEF